MFLIKKLQNFFSDKKVYSRFINNNNRLLSKNTYKSEKKILVEYFNFKPSYISYSYFSQILSEKYESNIFFYNPSPKSTKQKIYNKINDFLNISNLKISKSLNSHGIITPKLQPKHLNEVVFKKILKKIKHKKDILEIKIFSIPIGDLIYDEYLIKYQKGTINIKDENFLSFLKYSVDLFLYWYEYLDKNKIKAMICSHTTYFIGLPARIAVFKLIPCYCVSNSFAYYLTKKEFRQYSNFKILPKIFQKIPKKISNKYVKIAKKNIIKFFLEKEKFETKKFFKKKSRPKKSFNVLIAAHCFTDAVHIHGKDRIFVDHFDWIEFLGKASLKTNYNWFIKLHPSQYDNNYERMNDLIRNYPKLRLLPKQSKNINLLDKIDCVLTVHGTVAREYPMFNIPVLNASHDGPYVGYDFSYSFKSLRKYEEAIINLRKFKVKKRELNKIFEQYSVKYLLHYHFMGFNKHMHLTKKFKSGRLRQSNFIMKWNNQIDLNKHNRHTLDVKKFINSKKHIFYGDNTSEESKYLNI